jgi:hypothetical protein
MFHRLPYQELSLELGLFVCVGESMAVDEIPFGDFPGSAAGNIGSGYMGEALKAVVFVDLPGELKQARGAHDIDAPQFRKVSVKFKLRCGMDNVRQADDQCVVFRRVDPQIWERQVSADDPNPAVGRTFGFPPAAPCSFEPAPGISVVFAPHQNNHTMI